MNTLCNDRDAVYKKLFFRCVTIPLALALIALASTEISADTQQKIVAGLPVILWLWLGIAIGICLVMVQAVIAAMHQLGKSENVTE